MPRQTKITAATIAKEITRLDPNVAVNSDEWVAYAICLSSAVVGADEQKISEFLSIPMDRFAHLAANLRRNKVWRGNRYPEAWFGENGGAELVLDICVAMGYMGRAKGGA